MNYCTFSPIFLPIASNVQEACIGPYGHRDSNQSHSSNNQVIQEAIQQKAKWDSLSLEQIKQEKMYYMMMGRFTHQPDNNLLVQSNNGNFDTQPYYKRIN